MDKHQTRINYDRLSSIYDLLAKPEHRYITTGIQALGIRPGQHILEIGFGSGHTLIELAMQVGDHGRVSGIDLSAGMARVAKRVIHISGINNRVNLTLGDAAGLPFKTSSFDIVFMSFTLELFGETEMGLVLQGCQRMLKPGGNLCVIGLSKTEQSSRMVRLYEWAHTRFPKIIDCRPVPLQQLISQAGFSISSTKTSPMWGLPVDIVLAYK